MTSVSGDHDGVGRGQQHRKAGNMIFKFGYLSLLACAFATLVLLMGCRDGPTPPEPAERPAIDKPKLSEAQVRRQGKTNTETVIQGLSG